MALPVCPQCGSIATFEDVSGTFWDDNAHYWRKTMEPYQDRVVAEKKELDEKLTKLENFIFRSGGKWFDVPEAERLRMVKQYGYMSDYSRILGERIAAFQTQNQP